MAGGGDGREWAGSGLGVNTGKAKRGGKGGGGAGKKERRNKKLPGGAKARQQGKQRTSV